MFTLEYQKGLSLEFQQIRDTHFWSNNLMNSEAKRQFTLSVNVVVGLYMVLWFLAVTVVITYAANYGSFSTMMYNENWPFFVKILHKILSTLFITFTYFIGNTQLCYYAHCIVHGYLQMGILTAHFRQEIGKYKKIKLKNKIHSKVYQSEVNVILKRCINHYQMIKMLVCFLLLFLIHALCVSYFRYGSKISAAASKISVLHFLPGAVILAVGLTIVLFVSTS